ncbi:unnamed protein product [marine sediment metagenome]|jgi:hypothetical protein|uniref:Uncharacterized protein n=1 Tax=marine sediment metagenome TaxID=412755 RepID=X0RYK7_9ZZZZ|tara:strand:+ start:84 stop:218 length:135 start_codon:yes stop_codon:yes gene_type:complete
MGINFSSDTSKAIIQEYEYRIEALLNKITFLEAKLEVVNNQLNK